MEKYQTLIDNRLATTEIPRAQRRAFAQKRARVLVDFTKQHDRNDAIALAYWAGHDTIAAIAAHVGLHCTTMSRLVKAYECV